MPKKAKPKKKKSTRSRRVTTTQVTRWRNAAAAEAAETTEANEANPTGQLVAALIGGGGAAIVGGILKSRHIMHPVAAGLALAAGGLALSTQLEGTARAALQGVAAAGASQVGLELLESNAADRRITELEKEKEVAEAVATKITEQLRAYVASDAKLLPPPSASGAAMTVAMTDPPARRQGWPTGLATGAFRDAAADLGLLDAEEEAAFLDVAA